MVETSSRSLHLFISHEEKEKKIAISLKRLIKHIFRDKIDVFVSSDDESIPSGKQWFDVLTTALRQADYVVILCSGTAVKRPWINFELGGACLLKKDIIPLCIHNMQFSQLPPPYSNFQGFVASDYIRLSKLFRDMADRISCPLPPFDMTSTEYHRVIHNLSSEEGFVSLAMEGSGTYIPGNKLNFSGTATDGSEIVKLKIYNAADPYSLLEELKVAIQNDQTYVQEIDSSRYPPGQYYVLAETQKGIYTKVTFLLRSMKPEPTPLYKKFLR
ncbi:MAG: toll/interleukin-1 receptor domain-containing protein [Methanofollis sp.]|uniref:toll/interleukin-1 receptor domain-containing protein n=1 Tax=Methanofollis sp. TaxID=2052835 RepID=UPI002610509D|nr:toll/interleukin-1 receptor domain-containing protein [Methanofollis sp.]MDD4255955.1 toll/interleukin-1 receptor domain-containing protein [Methanofollis sp.]